MILWVAPTLFILVALMFGVPILLHHDLQRAERLSIRMRSLHPDAGPDALAPARKPSTVLRTVTAIGEAFARSGVLSARTLEHLRQTLQVADFRNANGLGLFVGTKLLLVVGLPFLGVVLLLVLGIELPHQLIVLAVAAIIGLLAPTRPCSICASATCAGWKPACRTHSI